MKIASGRQRLLQFQLSKSRPIIRLTVLEVLFKGVLVHDDGLFVLAPVVVLVSAGKISLLGNVRIRVTGRHKQRCNEQRGEQKTAFHGRSSLWLSLQLHHNSTPEAMGIPGCCNGTVKLDLLSVNRNYGRCRPRLGAVYATNAQSNRQSVALEMIARHADIQLIESDEAGRQTTEIHNNPGLLIAGISKEEFHRVCHGKR